MPGSTPRPVYAIVVNYNGWRDTLECLESLLRSDYPALRVIVCDNASTDDSVARIRAWAQGKDHVMLVECEANLGFAGANNVALRYVMQCPGEPHALLFNNDAVAEPHAVSAMVEVAERAPGCGAVGATVLRYHEPDVVDTLAGGTINRATGMVKGVRAGSGRGEARPETVAMDYVSGCCLLAPQATLASVGPMAEQYFLYGEDADWCLRMTRSGRPLRYAPAAEIWHKGGASVVHRSAVHDYYAVRGTLMLMHRHFPATLPLVLAHAVYRFLLPKLVRGQWRRLGAAARGYRDFLAYAIRQSGAAAAR